MHGQKQGQDKATLCKQRYPLAADFGKWFGFHREMENFQFLDKGSLTRKQLPLPTVL
jgi:hypothetical protein